MDTPNPNPQPSLNLVAEPVIKRRVRPSKRRPSDAPDDVGIATPLTKQERERVKQETEPVEKTTIESRTILMDPPTEWVDEPQMADQISQDGAWKIDRREARVFNLSDEGQLVKYNDLLALCDKPKTNCYIASENTQFDPAKGVWSVLVKLAFVKFRKIINKEKR